MIAFSINQQHSKDRYIADMYKEYGNKAGEFIIDRLSGVKKTGSTFTLDGSSLRFLDATEFLYTRGRNSPLKTITMNSEDMPEDKLSEEFMKYDGMYHESFEDELVDELLSDTLIQDFILTRDFIDYATYYILVKAYVIRKLQSEHMNRGRYSVFAPKAHEVVKCLEILSGFLATYGDDSLTVDNCLTPEMLEMFFKELDYLIK